MSVKKNAGKVVYPVLLGLFTLLFFFDTLILGKVFFFRDFSRYFYPYKKFATEWLQSGVFPLWNPLSSCGTPFFAGLQSQVAYPLSLFHYLLPFDFGLHLFIAVHYFLAAYFLYLLCLDLGFKRPGAFLGGLIFAFSGYTVSLVDMTTSMASVIWLPIILLFYRRALFEAKLFKKGLYSAASALAVLCQFLGGEPTILYGTCGLLLLFSAVYYEKKSGWVILPVVLLTAGLLASFQLLPFMEFLKNSDRYMQSAELTRQFNSQWSLPPAQLLAAVAPYFTGDLTATNVGWSDSSQLWLKSVYFGMVPVALCLASFFLIRKEKEEFRRLMLFLFMTALLSVLFALGSNTAVYPLLFDFVPGYSSIRFPVKFIFGAVFSVSVLSALVFDRAVAHVKTGIEKKSYTIFILSTITAVLVSLLFLIVFRGKLIELLPNAVFSADYFDNVKRFDILVFYYFESSLFLISSGLIFILFFRGLISRNVLVGGILLLVAGDLFVNNYFINPKAEAGFYSKLTQVEELLYKQKGSRVLLELPETERGRVFARSLEEALWRARMVLLPNQNMPSGIYVANAYDSLLIGNYSKKFEKMMATGKVRYVSMLSVDRLLTTGRHLEKSIFKEEKNFGAVKLYGNPAALHRCYYTEEFISFASEEGADKYIMGNDFDPLKEAVISNFGVEGAIKNPAARQIRGLELVKNTPNSVEVIVDAPEAGLVVLTDNFYPGWQAFVDGEETKVAKVNGLFKGVFCGKGRHEVKFLYLPDSFRYGLLISLIAFLGVFLALLILYNVNHGRKALKTDRRRKKPSHS